MVIVLSEDLGVPQKNSRFFQLKLLIASLVKITEMVILDVNYTAKNDSIRPPLVKPIPSGQGFWLFKIYLFIYFF